MRLEFGCGKTPPQKGYRACDVQSFPHVDYVCNAWEIEKYVEANSVEIIYSRHFFEHLTFEQGDATLGAWKNILCKGGIITMIVPDIEFHVKQFNEGDLARAFDGFWGHQEDDYNDVHKSGYTFNTLRDKLILHEFSLISRVDDLPKNLHVSCVKI